MTYRPVIYLSFADDDTHPLPALQAERAELTALFSPLAGAGQFQLEEDPAATVPRIRNRLLEHYDRLEIFHFAGHAGRHFLQLADQPARAEGIARLLGYCPNLKLIVLNGCSTRGQVERLLQLPNDPVVVATGAPVDDRAATVFATTFYQALALRGERLGRAFDLAVDAVRLLEAVTVDTGSRVAGDPDWEAAPEQSVWGVFSNTPSGLRWTIGDLGVDDRQLADHFRPNEHLLAELPAYLAPHHPAVDHLIGTRTRGRKSALLDLREAILKALPYPVSEQVRKLLVRRKAGALEDFFDQLDTRRLRQLVATYHTALELLTFALLANLWELLGRDNAPQLTPEQRETFLRLFDLAPTRSASFARSCLAALYAVRDIFAQSDTPFFFTELAPTAEIFDPQSAFARACQFLSEVAERLEPLSGDRVLKGAALLCVEGEQQLVRVVGATGFLGAYTLASIKEIDVIRYRHVEQPTFRHRLVRLVQRLTELDDEDWDRDDYLYTSSVLLLRADGDDPSDFLNLSPFIIDENAFDYKSPLPKLDFFRSYSQRPENFTFKHAYQPDNEFNTKGREEFSVIGAQFDQLAQFLFDRPLRRL